MIDMRKFILLTVFLPVLLYGQNDRPGSTSAQFLTISVSPRAASMGEAYISVADGAEATVYNPAALAWVTSTEFAFTHTEWFAGINHEFVAAVHRFGDLGTFGLSMTALYTDEMDVTTPLRPEGTGETFYATNLRVGLSYARHLTGRVTFGATINFIYLSLYTGVDENAISADISAAYVTDFHDFKFAMRIANFGSEIKFINEPYPLPVSFIFGFSMNAIELERNKLLVSVNGIKPNDGSPVAVIGAEWDFNSLIFLRGGYRLNSEVETYSFGTGIQLELSQFQIRFDYSYSDFSSLSGAHRFGLMVRL